jgi:hypothetical protein
MAEQWPLSTVTGRHSESDINNPFESEGFFLCSELWLPIGVANNVAEPGLVTAENVEAGLLHVQIGAWASGTVGESDCLTSDRPWKRRAASAAFHGSE